MAGGYSNFVFFMVSLLSLRVGKTVAGAPLEVVA
jgi:hypothetical protein